MTGLPSQDVTSWREHKVKNRKKKIHYQFNVYIKYHYSLIMKANTLRHEKDSKAMRSRLNSTGSLLNRLSLTTPCLYENLFQGMAFFLLYSHN